MSLDLTISEFVDSERIRSELRDRNDSAGRRTGGSPFIVLQQWDPVTGGQLDNFCWDQVTPYCWDDGTWFGEIEMLKAWLLGDLSLRRGTGEVTYTRPSDTTRLDEFSDVEAVAADEAPFDWLIGPGSIERYALRMSESDADLIVASNLNFSRRLGGFSFWLKSEWNGVDANQQVALLSDDWFVQFDSGFVIAELRNIDGTLYQVTADVSLWLTNEWHHVVVDWSRADGELRLWLDGALAATTATSGRFAEFDSDVHVGTDGAGNALDAHLVDLRTWPIRFTENLAETMFALKA